MTKPSSNRQTAIARSSRIEFLLFARINSHIVCDSSFVNRSSSLICDLYNRTKRTYEAFCPATVLREAYFWHFAFGLNFNLEEIPFSETEHVGNDVRGEHLNLVIEEQDLVVVALPCE